jgi:hypothetical protein
MFSDSIVGTETKSTFVAHLSQMGLPLQRLTDIFFTEFRQFIRTEQAKLTAAKPDGPAGSKPGLVPVHPCPRIYTCAFGNQMSRYREVQQLTDVITAEIFPSGDEPVLERILVKATANINNQVLLSSQGPELFMSTSTVMYPRMSTSRLQCCSFYTSLLMYLRSFCVPVLFALYDDLPIET